jgi:hypothetical protein
MSKAKLDDLLVQSSPSRSKRILALDIIRGYLLLVILVGHIELPPNFYDFFTGRGRLFVSAAEGFFFLSGLLVGMVYRRRLSLGMKFIFKKMWTRAAELYVGSVILTLLYAFIVARTNHFYIKDGLPNPVDWPNIIGRTLSLRFEYGWADFLGRFAILMLIAPLVFYLIAKGRWRLVLIAIIAGWLFRQQNFTLAWQIIFNGGILIGFYWDELNVKWKSLSRRTKMYIKRSVITVTVISFTLSYATVYILSELNTFLSSSPQWLKHFTLSWNNFNQHIWIYADKWTMGPVRLILFFVWAAVVYAWVARREETINSRTKGILLLVGQNSLFVYIFHSVIVLVFKFFIPAKTNPLQNFTITTLALLILIFGTYVYKYLRLNWPNVSPGGFYDAAFKKGRHLLRPSS